MFGAFIQLNQHTSQAESHPVGYIITESGCWEWVGAKSGGYGKACVGGKTVKAHRFVFELMQGPIPEGLTLDHLCRKTDCVNPAHLEPVRQRVNTLRGMGYMALNARKDKCPQGHPFTPDNLVRSRVAKGHRICLECSRRSARLSQRRHRAGL